MILDMQKQLSMGKKNIRPQTALITKVIVLECETLVIKGSGYAIVKADGSMRLDAMDMSGNTLAEGWYDVRESEVRFLAFVPGLIQ